MHISAKFSFVDGTLLQLFLFMIRCTAASFSGSLAQFARAMSSPWPTLKNCFRLDIEHLLPYANRISSSSASSDTVTTHIFVKYTQGLF